LLALRSDALRFRMPGDSQVRLSSPPDPVSPVAQKWAPYGAAVCRDGTAKRKISIVIPTQRRPGGLARAARSVMRQRSVDPADLELVIVDNDCAPSAKPVARVLAAESPFPLRYVHEPDPGVANARNAGVTLAQGELIAFLDDDEEASADWLAALTEVQARFGADVVFGPVQARTPSWVKDHRAYLQAFFSREGPCEAGVIGRAYGCGDSLVRRSALPDPRRPFSPARNETGGEDDCLFDGMRRSGARFAWAPAALVFEDPAPERLTLRYALARAFAYGQGPTYICATASPPRPLSAARWMAIGVLQSTVWGAAALGKWIVRAPDRAFAFDRAARGLGKVLFGGPFKRGFYGKAALRPADGASGEPDLAQALP
jgi:succinoglycan biosynthesis protein ExoM